MLQILGSLFNLKMRFQSFLIYIMAVLSELVSWHLRQVVLPYFLCTLGWENFLGPLIVSILLNFDELSMCLWFGIKGAWMEKFVVITRVLIWVRDHNLLCQCSVTCELINWISTLDTSREFVAESGSLVGADRHQGTAWNILSLKIFSADDTSLVWRWRQSIRGVVSYKITVWSSQTKCLFSFLWLHSLHFVM